MTSIVGGALLSVAAGLALAEGEKKDASPEARKAKCCARAEKDGKTCVAEVKTGERALDLRHGPTRRQLLEYQQAFGVEGVLLVDAEGGSVSCVSFLAPSEARGVSPLWIFAAGLLSGLALGLWWARSTGGSVF